MGFFRFCSALKTMRTIIRCFIETKQKAPSGKDDSLLQLSVDGLGGKLPIKLTPQNRWRFLPKHLGKKPQLSLNHKLAVSSLLRLGKRPDCLHNPDK